MLDRNLTGSNESSKEGGHGWAGNRLCSLPLPSIRQSVSMSGLDQHELMPRTDLDQHEFPEGGVYPVYLYTEYSVTAAVYLSYTYKRVVQ